MKNQIVTLIIGILIGSVVSTIVFIGIRSTDKKPSNDKFSEGFEENMKGERPSFDDSKFKDRKENNNESNSNESNSNESKSE